MRHQSLSAFNGTSGLSWVPNRASNGLTPIIYKTRLGKAYWGNCLHVLRAIPSCSVDLVVTSPPFALRRKKSYGNVSADKYVEWFLPYAEEIARVLKGNGSFVLDIGGSWNKGEPTRTLYHFDLLLKLCSAEGLFRLAQEFYWYNPAKMPAPAQWVTIDRVRVKDAINPIWWLSKCAWPKASNRRVLKPYTKSMKELLIRGYNSGLRPSGHVVSKHWGTKHKGAIPPNVITAANTRSSDPYIDGCKKHHLELHPARFVSDVPKFFIDFLTRPGDTVLDPFAGSNVVGAVAERRKRRWVSVDIDLEYVIGSAFRFGKRGAKVFRQYRRELTNFRRRKASIRKSKTKSCYSISATAAGVLKALPPSAPPALECGDTPHQYPQ